MADSAKRKPDPEAVDLAAAKYQIRSMASEDWYELFEVFAALRHVFPAMSSSGLLALGQRALRSLIEEGVVYLCYANPRTREERPVAAGQIDQLLGEITRWQPTGDEMFLTFVATPSAYETWPDVPHEIQVARRGGRDKQRDST